MKNLYVSLVLFVGVIGSYFIWTSETSIEIPNEKFVYEQVDKRKLSNFQNLIEDLGLRHKGQEEFEDSLNTIMSASKKLTIKTEVYSHSKNVSSPFPWGLMTALWGSLGLMGLVITRFKTASIEAEKSDTTTKNNSKYFSTDKSIGDLNQTIVSINHKLELQAQNSDRYIDLELKEDLSDCFVERKRLERLVGGFINASFQMIKSDDESKGMVIQTNEDGGRYKLVCFLDNFDQNHLSNQKLPQILKHFSVLEKQFSGCRPSIDFHYVDGRDHKGLEIELSFDNSSELESRLSRSVQV